MVKNFISEDDIEKDLLRQLQSRHQYEILNCHTADPDDLNDGSNRSDKRDVLLRDRLSRACQKLNPELPPPIVAQIVESLAQRRGAVSETQANREIYSLIRDGVSVQYEDKNRQKQTAQARLIDFNNPENNHYLAVSQLWIKAAGRQPKAQYRRPDVILYINGIPLVFIELKNANVKLRAAYEDNLQDYKNDIPQLFHYNGFCLLSNALETKIGSAGASWDYFFNWFRIADEKEPVHRQQISDSLTSLEYALDGLAQPRRLLDYLENFILFQNKNGVETKIIAQNHQFLGVNNAYQRFLDREQYHGKLGVFWHTQGSGKSFSMIFYARKIMRKVNGNFTFVVVTDRQDLDRQIYQNFLGAGVIGKNEAACPKDALELRQFLSQNKKIIFTLIHKFRYDKGKKYPRLFDPEKTRREMIVIVDEAHRTQYQDLADNMRAGLSGAHFIAFTGTPLLGKERKTNKWFGDYVSEYNFQQAMADKATVPLFYQKRVPQVLLQNDDLNDEFYDLLEEENLDDSQQESLERQFAQELEIIKRPDRLETIAQDIVDHFPRRGYLGKAMVVCVDKFTAVALYDKVQQHWKTEQKTLRGRIHNSPDELEKRRLKRRLEYMKNVEMAVVISDPSADQEKFAQQGLNIKPHIERLAQLDERGHDIEHNFKDPYHPLQMVFVCAMWLTGFDAPTVSTLYLDKPMKNHTLMQAIARANRVAPVPIPGLNSQPVEKTHGEIVDYYNVFRNMKKALKDYAQGGADADDLPVQEKDRLFTLLAQAIAETEQFCQERQIDLAELASGAQQDKPFNQLLHYFENYANRLLSRDDWHKSFNVYHNTVVSLYEACKPEINQKSHQRQQRAIAIIRYLRGVIDGVKARQNLDEIQRKISELLDESIVVNGDSTASVQEPSGAYRIIERGKIWDLSQTNFEQLKKEFKDRPYPHIEITELRSFIEEKLQQMTAQNSSRVNFAQRLQRIIDRYNAGASAAENYYDELVNFAQSMREEAERHVREGLTEDELEVFDLLKKDKLTQAETQQVKLAAKTLLQRLKDGQPEVLVQDWWKDSQTQKVVEAAIETVLDETLPSSYDRVAFKEKCHQIFGLTLDFARQRRKWAV